MKVVHPLSSRVFTKASLAAPICFCALVFLFTTGCISPTPKISASRPQGTDFSLIKKFYISFEKEPNQRKSKTLKAVQNALAAYGTAGLGPLSEMPTDTECRVVVNDRWFWDMAWYLLKLQITLYDGRTGVLIGDGSSYRAHPAVRRQPAFMANEVLDAIYHASP